MHRKLVFDAAVAVLESVVTRRFAVRNFSNDLEAGHILQAKYDRFIAYFCK